MTKLTYVVGNTEIATYAEAVRLSEEVGLPMIPRYAEITEHSAYNPTRTAMKIQKMREKRA